MSNLIRSGPSLGSHQDKERTTKRHNQRSYNVGHFLNDAVVGMSNRTAGFLWIVSNSADATLGVITVEWISPVKHRVQKLSLCTGTRPQDHWPSAHLGNRAEISHMNPRRNWSR